jgi:hypothetical protein
VRARPPSFPRFLSFLGEPAIPVLCQCHTWGVCLFVVESFFFLFAVLGFELRDHTSSYPTSPFCDGFYQHRVSRTIFLGWLRTMILLISVS